MKNPFKKCSLLVLPFLCGCTALSVRQYSPLDENNYAYNLGDRTDYRSLSSQLITLPEEYSLVDYNPENCRRGYVEIQKGTNGEKGFLSFFDGQIIIPCRYVGFSFFEDKNNGTYIFAQRSDGFRDIYDYRGYLVDSMVSDSGYKVSTSIVVLDYQKEHLVEIVTNGGVQRQNEILSDRSRVPFVVPCDLLLQGSNGFLPLGSSLANIALPNYMGSVTEEGVFTVTKNGKMTCQFQVPKGCYAMSFYWKAFIYQTITVAADGNYTYEDSGVRYVLHTYRIQLADGKKTELNCPYLLSPIRSIYDDLGQAKWLLATVLPIQNKRVLSSRRYVFNNDGEVVFNTADNPAYSDDVLFLKWNAIYSSDGVVMDRFFQKTASLPYPITTISYPTSSFISTEHQKFGVTSYGGEQIFPNEYVYIHLKHSYNNFGFGMKDGDYYALNPLKGISQQITLKSSERLDDLFIGVNRVSDLQDDGSYKVRYLFYDASYMEHFFWRLPDASCTLSTYYDQLVVDAYHDSVYAWQSFSLR